MVSYHQLKLYTSDAVLYCYYSLCISKDQSINYRAVDQQPKSTHLASFQQAAQLTFFMLLGSSVRAFCAENSFLLSFRPAKVLKQLILAEWFLAFTCIFPDF